MNATIRAQHLGLTYHRETARQFSVKFIISLLVISMATAVLILEETRPEIMRGQRSLNLAKNKARRAKTKLKSLLL
jgi:hypothetical protein